MAELKTKAGFWCPPDIQIAIQALVEKEVYADQSKTIIALLRKALRDDTALPSSLRERLNQLAVDLDRTPEVMMRLCVEGILEMVDSPATALPLVVEEVRLRQRRGRNGA
jgi:Arc/MetJ-type ribon-helix-helix transcriptional regulator